MVDLGIIFDLRNPPRWRRKPSELYGSTLELCEEADRLGVSSIWLSEHHQFDDDYLPQPLVFAASVAARTRRARIGTAVTLAPMRSPQLLAEEAAVVDTVSDGRLDLGLGAGYMRHEFQLYGVDYADRRATTIDHVERMRELWASGSVTPRPQQQPLPIWLGFQGPVGARRAGRLGEGLLSVRRELFDDYRAGLAEGGHPPESARVAGHFNLWVSHDPERAWHQIVEHVRDQWDTYAAHGVKGTDEPLPPPIDPEAWRTNGLGAQRGHFCLGTPAEVATAVAEYVAGTPIRTVIAFAGLPGMSHDQVRENIHLLVNDLAPALKKVTTAL